MIQSEQACQRDRTQISGKWVRKVLHLDHSLRSRGGKDTALSNAVYDDQRSAGPVIFLDTDPGDVDSLLLQGTLEHLSGAVGSDTDAQSGLHLQFVEIDTLIHCVASQLNGDLIDTLFLLPDRRLADRPCGYIHDSQTDT